MTHFTYRVIANHSLDQLRKKTRKGLLRSVSRETYGLRLQVKRQFNGKAYLPMTSGISEAVKRDGNIIAIKSLSSPFVVGSFIRAIYQGSERGYTDFILDFSNVEGVYPNVCVPIAGLLEYYQSEQNIFFTPKNVPKFLIHTNTLAPSIIQDNETCKKNPLNVVWKFSNADEVYDIVNAYRDTVSKSSVCQTGVLLGLEWCLNEIMDNVLQHADTSHGYVMGQIHSASQHMAVCIYDYGQGILNSLSSSPHASTNAVDAITGAIKEGVTRDNSIGQGNGMWGLSNIVRSNSGVLNITSGSGFLGIRSDNTKTSNSVPYLSSKNNCTTVDFQIDFDKEISIAEALGGHEPTNLRIENLEDDENNVVYKLIDKASGTGTRQSGVAMRNDIINISTQTNSLIIIDFTGISLISSSFADELIGKLVIEFGFVGFIQRFRLVGMNTTTQAITNRSVSQRMNVTA